MRTPRALIEGHFSTTIPATWDSAKQLWDPVHSFFSVHGLDGDEAYSLTMTTAELLENAVKYGDWSDPARNEIRLFVEVTPEEAMIEVEHPAPRQSEELRRLDDRIQWLRGFQNPFEAYVARLMELGAHQGPQQTGGLGLCRIAYEAHCLIDFYVTPENHLRLSAVYQPQGSLRA
jgi:hypothetical protein